MILFYFIGHFRSSVNIWFGEFIDFRGLNFVNFIWGMLTSIWIGAIFLCGSDWNGCGDLRDLKVYLALSSF